MELLLEVIEKLFTVQTILALFAGTIGGVLIGSLPGLTATMGIALLIPVTFGMDPVAGLTMLTAIYTAGIYGGSLSAILLHTPGTPASAATALDGYQLALKGKGLQAIRVATIASMIGGVISALALLTIAPPLSLISLRFNAPEFFLIAVFGLTIIGSLASGSVIKGLSAGVFGLIVSFVGIDLLTAFPRYTFGIHFFEGGVSFVPAMIGLFSLSQVIIMIEELKDNKNIKKSKVQIDLKGKIFSSWMELKSLLGTILRSSVIGVFVGMLPGAGGDIASWVAYNEAKRFSKEPEKFGTGQIEGVAASEAANNAVTGGALIPLLILGIPGSTATAVLLGGLLIQGLLPGRQLFTMHASTTYAIIIAFLGANILMGVFGLLGAKHIVKVTNVPTAILVPIITVLSVVGSFAINNRFFDVYVMVFFGLFGYLLRKTGFHPAPVVLGMILGPIAEIGFRQSLIMARGEYLLFYLSRPICLILIALIILSLFSQKILDFFKNRRSTPKVYTK